jgi:hypothetical protein
MRGVPPVQSHFKGEAACTGSHALAGEVRALALATRKTHDENNSK